MLDQLTTTVNDLLERAKGELAKFDLPNVELPKVEFPKVDFSNLAAFDFTNLDVRNLDLPKFDLPGVDVPDVDLAAGVERAADVARDVVYAGIGAAVIAAERVDAGVRRAVRRAV